MKHRESVLNAEGENYDTKAFNNDETRYFIEYAAFSSNSWSSDQVEVLPVRKWHAHCFDSRCHGVCSIHASTSPGSRARITYHTHSLVIIDWTANIFSIYLKDKHGVKKYFEYAICYDCRRSSRVDKCVRKINLQISNPSSVQFKSKK